MTTSPPVDSQKVDSLEALRGVAAFVVLGAHLVSAVADRTHRGSPLAPIFNWGTEAVMLFFVLSGVVIRLSEERRVRTRIQFVVNRAIRLLPLYLIAIAVSYAVIYFGRLPLSAPVLVGNLFFLQSLQGFIVPVLATDLPLWSLSYEVAFYLIYAVCIRRPIAFIAWGALALVSLLSIRGAPAVVPLNHLRMVLVFSTVWLAGYSLAALRHRFSFSRSAALFCLPLAFSWARAHFVDDFYDPFRLVGFGLFAGTLLSALIGTARQQVRFRFSVRFALVASVLAVFILTSNSRPATVVALSALAIGGAIVPPRFLERIVLPGWLIRSAVYLGSISYALYIIHFPIMKAVFALDLPAWPCASITAALAVACSHFLERVAQPAFANMLRRRRADEPRTGVSLIA